MSYFAVFTLVNKGQVVVWGLGRSRAAALRNAKKATSTEFPFEKKNFVECTRLAYTYADEYGALVGQKNPLRISRGLMYLEGEENYPVQDEIGKRQFRYLYDKSKGRLPAYITVGRRFVINPGVK